MSTLSFELTPVEISVELKKGSEAKTYTLVEMDGKQRDVYLAALSKKVKLDPSGKADVTNFDGLQADLIVRCMKNEEGEYIGADEVQSWPARTQSAIFKKCQEINGLNEDEDSLGN